MVPGYVGTATRDSGASFAGRAAGGGMDQDIVAAARRALDGHDGLGAAVALWADGAPVLAAGLGWQD